MKPLDNIFWDALSRCQKALTVGTDSVRRYAPGLPNLLAFSDARQPALAEFRPFCAPDERFYCTGWSGPAPEGWQVEREADLALMVWDGPRPEQPMTSMWQLQTRHLVQTQQLAELTQPGPFGVRALELGEYLGCFEDDRLVAMAGERMHAEGLREISAVCTHPDFRGRGFAARLVAELVRRQMARGETPFLHVLVSNKAARDLYRSMGFRDFKISSVRIVSAQK